MGGIFIFNGIDVSNWQGDIDWQQVKSSGMEFAFIKATEGTDIVDSYFYTNAERSQSAGIKRGVYHYLLAYNEALALEEADFFLENVKKYSWEYPLALDIEAPALKNLSVSELTSVAKAFLSRVRAAGYNILIYASKLWLENKLDLNALSGYGVWLAEYNDEVTYTGKYDVWQYSDNGTVAGINKLTDKDISYVDFNEGGDKYMEKTISVVLNGKEIETDGYFTAGRNLFTADFFKALGYEVSYNAETKQVILNAPKITVSVNGSEKEISALNVNGYNYCLLRQIAEATQAFSVDYENNRVVISTN